MARERNYRAEYERRQALARSQGFPSYKAMRTAREAGTAPSAGPRQVVRTSVGSIVTSAAQSRTVEAQLAHAAAAGKHVKVTATVRLADGSRRTVELGQHGGVRADQLAANVALYGMAGALARLGASIYGDDDDLGNPDDWDLEDWQLFIG